MFVAASESTGSPTDTWNPADSSVCWAWSTDMPTTFGRSFITVRSRLDAGSGKRPPGYSSLARAWMSRAIE